MGFAQWFEDVDEACIDIALVSIHDLPDADHRSAFDDEWPPRAWAIEVLADEGFPVEGIEP